MQSNLLRAAAAGPTRSDVVERQLRRYCPHVQDAVRGLAMRHPRIADLAASFPALLFALAVPRPGLDVARACELAVDGVALAEVAAAAELPLWLRPLPPEALARPLVKLPDGELLRRQITNHLPRSPKRVPTWLQAVADAAELAHDAFAVWIARELVHDVKPAKLDRLRLLGLWAWFSAQPGTLTHSLIEKPWMPAMGLGSALAAADDWLMNVRLIVNLGRKPMADMWLEPARVDGYDFVPLAAPADITEEAAAMRNCLRSYGYNLAHNRSRLWSIRKDGERVATLKIAADYPDPLLDIVELKAAKNTEAPREVWWAARQWLHLHDLPRVEMKRRDWGAAPLDRTVWISLWRPYWLAKRRIPQWLPLRPSRVALGAL